MGSGKKTRMPKAEKLTIIVDTQEKRPYRFERITPRPQIKVISLATGDYTIEGFEDNIAVERKSLIDAFGSFGKGRERFEKELERMVLLDFAAVVIEGDWLQILRNPPSRTNFKPKAFYASVIAWQQRYGVHFWVCPNRAFAEKTTYRILERFCKDEETRRVRTSGN